MSTPFLTVFTPAYNRAHTLPFTYESLKKQTLKEFIWLIVDDGSSDSTAELVSSWQQQDNGFEIRYIYKPNGGMHTAHNTAYENIDTEFNICIDSDDSMPENAVELIKSLSERVKKDNLAGIIALDTDTSGNIIGSELKSGDITTLSEFYAAGGSGDKKLVYRTDIIKKYPPYPVFEGEKYFALAYKYRLIDEDYRLLCLNRPLCIVDYQPDGSSATMLGQYLKNPKGFAFWRKFCMELPLSRKRLIIDCIHYSAESILSGQKGFIRQSPKRVLTLLVAPIGLGLAIYIRIKAG